MKKRLNRLKHYIDGWDAIFALCFSGFTWIWLGEARGGVAGLLGGIPAEDGNVLELVLLGKWLFLFAGFFAVSGRKLYEERELFLFSACRYSGFASWWRRHFLRLHVTNAVLFFAVCMLWKLYTACAGKSGAPDIAAAGYFFWHLSTLSSVWFLLDLTAIGKFMPGVLLIAEGMSYICSVYESVPSLAFGMYTRCAFTGTGDAVYGICAAETAIIVCCYFLGPAVWNAQTGNGADGSGRKQRQENKRKKNKARR